MKKLYLVGIASEYVISAEIRTKEMCKTLKDITLVVGADYASSKKEAIVKYATELDLPTTQMIAFEMA